MKNIFKLTFAISVLLFSYTALSDSISNDFIFIENQVDNEYFITPITTDPRFSGANVFTRYATKDQDSLGYMGKNHAELRRNENIDIWLENSPIDSPFIGNRCKVNDGNCPRSSYWSAQQLKNDGAYKIRQNNTGGGSNYVRPIFGANSYEYFKSMSTGGNIALNIKACRTELDYEPARGQSCQSVGGKIVVDDMFTVNKLGHIKLASNNALQEIFIDSNGNANIGLGAQFCQTGIVGKESGIICQLVNYNLQTMSDIKTLNIGLKLNPLYIKKGPSKGLVMFGNGKKWADYTNVTARPNTPYSEVMSQGNNELSLFLSSKFLKGLINDNVDLTKSQDFFTFAFYNSRVPQSGYYEFTPSNTLIIKPRDYGISIIPADFSNNPKKTGEVGKDPVVFNYIVTTSGSRQANTITAQVTGNNKIINRTSYCIFSSSDNTLNVPFSAYLSYTANDGSKKSKRASCDSQEISFSDALWERTSWDIPAQDEGSYYRTKLDLAFPMNEGISYWSLEGDDWMGSVTGSGEVKVTATWIGPDITP